MRICFGFLILVQCLIGTPHAFGMQSSTSRVASHQVKKDGKQAVLDKLKKRQQDRHFYAIKQLKIAQKREALRARGAQSAQPQNADGIALLKSFSKYRAIFAGISPAVIAALIAYGADATTKKYNAEKRVPHENSFDAHLIVLDAWLKKNKFKSLTGVAVCCIAAAACADVLDAGAYLDDRSHIVNYFSGGNT